MAEPTTLALEATRRLRSAPGYLALSQGERTRLDRDLRRIESALADDPYARGLEDELPMPPGLLPPGSRPPPSQAAPPPSAPAPPPPSPVGAIGRQAADAVAAIDFPAFVAGLVQGVFQAVVDATIQQVRAYADLVASISKSVDDFTRDNVSPNQARDELVRKHGQDLVLIVPPPGQPGDARVAPRPGRVGSSPGWLAEYGLAGEELNDELVEGTLLTRVRGRVGEERMQTLATMVLMGMSRVVVNDGAVRARLSFHAAAREQTTAEAIQAAQGAQVGLAGRSMSSGASTSMMVTTASANAQADASIRADLMGEVRLSFRTETFNLDNFANTAAIQLINRHARWQAPAPAATTPATTTPEGSDT